MYKEDFSAFREIMEEMMDYIIDEKGSEVISERHQKDFKKEDEEETFSENGTATGSNFTDVSFDDI